MLCQCSTYPTIVQHLDNELSWVSLQNLCLDQTFSRYCCRFMHYMSASVISQSKAIVESTNEKDVMAEDNNHAESVQSNDDDDQQIEEDSETGT